MAKLKKQVFGEISGALGSVIFRDYKGVNVASMRPSNINIPNDPSALARRARFTLAAKLAKAIRQSREVKLSWVFNTPSNLTTHSYMVQVNYPFVSDSTLSDYFRLVPEKNFIASVSSFEIRDMEIVIRINELQENTGINVSVEKNIRLYAVFFLSTLNNPELAPYSFLSVESNARTLNLNEQLDFTMPLSDLDKQLLNSGYQSRKAFLVAITLDETGKPVNYSDKMIYNLQ